MNRHLKTFILIALIGGQLLLSQYSQSFRLSVDFLYLIAFYFAVRSGFVKGVVSAALLGLVIDYFSGHILGVFSFSRTLSIFVVSEVSRFIDFRKNGFIFILLFFSLQLSNLVANGFFHLAQGYRISLQLVVVQPLVTALTGTLIVSTARMKSLLDVY